MKYTTNNSTRSVIIKITLQTGNPDHREINYQSEDFSVDAVGQISTGHFTNSIVFKGQSRHKNGDHIKYHWDFLNL